MRLPFLTAVFAGMTIGHLACVAAHVLTFTTARLPGWLTALAPGLLLAFFAALWCLDWITGRPAPADPGQPAAPRWVRRAAWWAIGYGMALGPYTAVNFALTMHNYPGKRKPAFAESRLITGHAMFFSYAGSLLTGVAWASRRWSDPPAADRPAPGSG